MATAIFSSSSSQDFLVTLSTLLRGSVYERLRWTFKLYDLNGDGCISRGELSEVVQAVHELMGRRPHQPEDDRKARDQVSRETQYNGPGKVNTFMCSPGGQGVPEVGPEPGRNHNDRGVPGGVLKGRLSYPIPTNVRRRHLSLMTPDGSGGGGGRTYE